MVCFVEVHSVEDLKKKKSICPKQRLRLTFLLPVGQDRNISVKIQYCPSAFTQL